MIDIIVYYQKPQGIKYGKRKNKRLTRFFFRIYNELEKDPKWIELGNNGYNFLKPHITNTNGQGYFTITKKGNEILHRDETITLTRKGNNWKSLFHLGRDQLYTHIYC